MVDSSKLSNAVDELLNLAHLCFEDESEDQFEAIEKYCNQFSIWQDSFSQELNNLDPEMLKKVELLSEQHQKVLNQAQVLLDGTEDKLQNFQKKAKGILSYLDILPKKISFAGTRKG